MKLGGMGAHCTQDARAPNGALDAATLLPLLLCAQDVPAPGVLQASLQAPFVFGAVGHPPLPQQQCIEEQLQQQGMDEGVQGSCMGVDSAGEWSSSAAARAPLVRRCQVLAARLEARAAAGVFVARCGVLLRAFRPGNVTCRLSGCGRSSCSPPSLPPVLAHTHTHTHTHAHTHAHAHTHTHTHTHTHAHTHIHTHTHTHAVPAARARRREQVEAKLRLLRRYVSTLPGEVVAAPG